MSSNTNINDDDVKRVLNGLQGHVVNMNRTAAGVQDLEASLKPYFQSGAATAFSRKINEWQAGYIGILEKFRALEQAVTGTAKIFVNVDEDGVAQANSWSGGDEYTSVLAGK
ncbi:hypothetical protein [Streptomyces sp. NPDC058548]|uniref:hypothetical protein n=1 Tax=unclassified Streptomyces TaxID=2593676 RepID=UPI00365325D6